jgi:transcriptional regulator with XRE-family HTH domain
LVDIAAIQRERIRRARLVARLRQSEVAALAGVSQTMVSRIELGRGGSVPFGRWTAVAATVGVDLLGTLDDSLPTSLDVLRRCHRLVADRALEGGWSAWTDLQANETLLVRPSRQEAAVVQIWDAIGSVPAAIGSFADRLTREALTHPDSWRVSGAIVVPATGPNRRRMTESDAAIRVGFPVRGAQWLGALGQLAPMPGRPGVIWTDQRMDRLRPMLPYLDRRRRDRRR